MKMTHTKTLDDKWIEYCQNNPEHGMGYQLADIVMENGESHTATIHNCSIANTLRPLNGNIKEINFLPHNIRIRPS